MKKIVLFVGLLLPWFISSLFTLDTSFYNQINLPRFAPAPIIFGVVWPILYVLIAFSCYMIFKEYGKKEKEYNHILLCNYLFNQLFPLLFFQFHSLFFSFVDTVVLLLSTLFLYYESKSLNETSSKLLLPYLFWNMFAMILSITIYFMNL
ncbi:MAG: tryptophan-rich sensory protein [Bacilli bacterium]|nr:tryptophan-rich sensory protein [Bacilli bacterium]